jgi:hypothetical protein
MSALTTIAATAIQAGMRKAVSHRSDGIPSFTAWKATKDKARRT